MKVSFHKQLRFQPDAGQPQSKSVWWKYTCLSLAKRLPKMVSAKQNPWFQKYLQLFLHEWMFSTIAGRKNAVMSTLCDVIAFSPGKTCSKIVFADQYQCFHPRKGIRKFQMHINEHVLNRCGERAGCYKHTQHVMKISCSALAKELPKMVLHEKHVFSSLKVPTTSLTAWMFFDGLNEHDSVVTYSNKYLLPYDAHHLK